MTFQDNKYSLDFLLQKIKADKERLKDKAQFIWLIGSQAKGTATKESDTDLLIVQYKDNMEDWKQELRYFASFLPGITLQTQQFLSDQWEKNKKNNSAFYQGVINKEDHIEILAEVMGWGKEVKSDRMEITAHNGDLHGLA
jgi:predicted nucleotidyltransferase